jgi:hypothetical protein
MNLRGGKVLPDLLKLKPPRGDKAVKVNTQEATPETSNKEGDKLQDVNYNVITHLKRIPALLSIYDAPMLAPELRDALVRGIHGETSSLYKPFVCE